MDKHFKDSHIESIKTIFENTLSVSLISEKIQTCTMDQDVALIVNEMSNNDFDVYGVENQSGNIIGYIEKDTNLKGTVGDNYKSFKTFELLSESTSLLKMLEIFKDKSRMFVLKDNNVEEIITSADLHKQPMRMLIFSYVSLIEMKLTAKINQDYPSDSWKELLSPKRVKKATDLFEVRHSNNEALSLIDSTQLCDKGTIIRKSKNYYSRMGFSSPEDCKGFFGKLEELRNNTAHSQEKLYENSNELIQIVLRIREITEAI